MIGNAVLGAMREIPSPDYPTLFFFERGEWWDYLMLVVVTVTLAVAAWATQRSKSAVIALLIVVPVALSIFVWPWSTQGTESAGWFPIVKQYSALIGSLSLVALQYFPRLRQKYWYLCIPPLILAVNILEAVIRDFQCYSIHGVAENGMATWGGPWNIMNGVAGLMNILAISGWAGIRVASGQSKAIVWSDLTVGWIIAYDLWNLSYVYNCLSDRAWYSGVVLLASCTIPPLVFRSLKGSWIQFRAYTLTFWSAVVLTFPHFMQDSMFAHRSAHNPTAMFGLALVALIANGLVLGYHVCRIVRLRRNPFVQEVYAK